jgi:hypothetical protein
VSGPAAWPRRAAVAAAAVAVAHAGPAVGAVDLLLSCRIRGLAVGPLAEHGVGG